MWSNLKNVSQRNQRTDRARECIVSKGTIFETFSLGVNHGGTFLDLMCVLVCPKNSGHVTALRKMIDQNWKKQNKQET